MSFPVFSKSITSENNIYTHKEQDYGYKLEILIVGLQGLFTVSKVPCII